MHQSRYGKSPHYEVLIAGGGFGGAYCGKYLGIHFGADASKRAALIADQNVLAFQPMLAEVVGASLRAAVDRDLARPRRVGASPAVARAEASQANGRLGGRPRKIDAA